MATIIINPTAASNGTGSLVDPKNTWVGLTFSPGNEYLQVAGTTYAGQMTAGYNILVPAGQGGTGPTGRVVIGACAPLTGERIRDGSSKAKIDGTGAHQSIRVVNNLSFVDIDGFEVFGTTGMGASRAVAVFIGANETSPATNCRFMNSHIHDIIGTAQPTLDNNALQIFGHDNIVRNVLVDNISDDGMWLQGERFLVEYCTVRRVGRSGRVAGDCLQLYGNTSMSSGGAVIRWNDFDHLDAPFKQAVIAQGDPSNASGCRIYGNRIRQVGPQGTVIALLVAIPRSLVFGNEVIGGTYGILIDKTASTTDGSNSRVMGNLVRQSGIGVVYSQPTGVKILNNTIVETTDSAIYVDTDTTADVRNNLILNCQKGIAMEFGGTEDYNCLYGIKDPGNILTSLGGGARTLGANSIQTDPRLGQGYELTPSSPCRGAGSYIASAKHMGGAAMNPLAPDIGAFRYRAQAAQHRLRVPT